MLTWSYGVSGWVLLFNAKSFSLTFVWCWHGAMEWVDEWLLFNAKSFSLTCVWCWPGAIEWVDECCCLMPSEQVFSHIMAITSYITMRWWWCLLCTKSTHLFDFYSASSLKQQSAGRHATLLKHIILIQSQTSLCYYFFIAEKQQIPIS